MDRVTLFGLFLAVVGVVLLALNPQISLWNYSFYVRYFQVFYSLVFASLGFIFIGFVLIMVRAMQWAKFKLHKGTAIGLALIGTGITVFFVLGQLTSNYPLYIQLLNNKGIILTIVASASLFLFGFLIIAAKTIFWAIQRINNQ